MKTNEKVKQALINVASHVDTEDRRAAAKEFGVHEFTIDRYLRGDARKEAFGVKLLKFLKERIEEREQLLNELTQGND